MRVLPVNFNQNQKSKNRNDVNFGMKIDDINIYRPLMRKYIENISSVSVRNESLTILQRFVSAAEYGEIEHDGLRLEFIDSDKKGVFAIVEDLNVKKKKKVKIYADDSSEGAILKKLTEYLDKKHDIREIRTAIVTDDQRLKVAAEIAGSLVKLVSW